MSMMIFSGNATPILAENIAQRLGMEMGKINVGRFSDGEILVEILENVRGKDIYIVQSTCMPANDNLMELLVMGDAFRRASAKRITAVMPYFGYARQDRRVRSARVPITAKVVADLIQKVGYNRLLTVDLHADQIQGFFSIPVDNIYATPVMLDDLLAQKFPNPMVVSPDVGGVIRARAIAKRLNDSDLAIIDKRRMGPNKAEIMHLIGDVQDRNCIIVDDIVDTAGTLCLAAQSLKANGAATVTAYITHPVLSGPAIDRINESDLDEVVVTDTIPLCEKGRVCNKVRQLSLANLLAETVQRIDEEESVSSLFAE